MNIIRATTDNKLLGVIRVFLGVVFFSTGVMKFIVPALAEAWSQQLIQAQIPLYDVNIILVPILEIVLGLVLLIGLYTRIGAFMVICIMSVAFYVHTVVANPELFPLQPKEPVIPVFMMILALIMVIRGAGSWSLDLRSTVTRK